MIESVIAQEKNGYSNVLYKWYTVGNTACGFNNEIHMKYGLEEWVKVTLRKWLTS